MKKIARTKKAMTILDALLAIAMFGIFFGFIVQLLLTGQESLKLGSKRQEAARMLQESIAAVSSIMKNDFRLVADGEYALATSSGAYVLATSSQQMGAFNRSIKVTSLDYWTKLIEVSVTWAQNLQRGGVLSFVWKIYDWSLGILDHHSFFDLKSVYKNSVDLSTTAGSSSLSVARAADWSKPKWYQEFDINTADGANDVIMYRNYLYVVAKSGGGPELVKINVDNLSGGELAIEDSWTFGRELIAGAFQESSNKAYLASADPYEITSLDLSSGLTSVIDVPGTAQSTDIWVSGDKIFLAKRNDVAGPELEIYNTAGTRIGSREVGADVYKVIADDQYVYLATAADNGELMIVNHNACTGTPPFTCVVARQYDMAGTADATALEKGEGNTWYVGRDDGSVYGLNIPNPMNVTQVWSRNEITSLIRDLDFDSFENVLMVASERADDQELSFYRLSDLSLSAVDLPSPGGANQINSVIKYGSFVYAVTDNTYPELQIVKALGGGWEQPVVAGTFNAPTTSDANRSFVDGNKAYVALDQTAGGPEFYVLDVSNPAAPSVLGSVEINADVNDVWVNDGYAYLATSLDNQELMVFDVSQATPQSVANIDLPSAADALSLVGDPTRKRLVVGTANNTSGYGYEVYVIDISGQKTVAGLRYLAGYNANGSVSDLDFDDQRQHLYLSTGDAANELKVLDMGASKDLVKLTEYNSDGSTANGVSYDEASQRAVLSLVNGGASNDLYIFETEDLKSAIADWSEPFNIVNNGEATGDGSAIVVDDKNYAYMGSVYTGSQSFYIYDISAPSYPVLVGSYNAGGSVVDVKIKGDYAYLTTTNSSKEFQLVNLTNRSNPTQSAVYNIPGISLATGLDVVATTTYVGTSGNLMYVLDTNSTTSIGFRNSFNFGKSIKDLSAGPEYVVVATNATHGGMGVIDVRNWNSMSNAAFFNPNGRCIDLWYDKPKDRVFLGCYAKTGYESLFLLDMKNPTSMVTLASEIVNYDIIDINVQGNRLYLTTDTAPRPVLIYDLVNNNDFVYADAFDPTGDADAVTFKDDHLYLAAKSSAAEFQVWGPSWVSSSSVELYKALDLNSDNYAALIRNQTVLVANGDSAQGLKLVDMTGANTAKVVNSLATGVSYGLSLAESGDVYLTSADDERELQIVRAGPQIETVVGVGWFTSRPYNSGLVGARWRNVIWDEADNEGSTALYLRTAPDNQGSPGAWSQWLGPSSWSDGYAGAGTDHQINNLQNDGSNDQWLQYRMILKPASPSSSPEVLGLKIFYE